MNITTGRLWSLLKANIWFLAALFLPLAIRCIPEIISWPYPLGIDTIRYIPLIESAQAFSSPLVFFQTQLFYPIGTLSYWLIGNSIVVIKVLGPLLMGLVAIMMYLYAKRGLGWSAFKSFLVAFLVAIYFASLRNSWDLYAQSVGLIFLLATLVVLKASVSPKRYALAFVFMILTVLSHQLISVILFFILALWAIIFLAKRLKIDLILSLVSLGLTGALFLFRQYSSQTGILVIPSGGVAADFSVSLALSTVGLMFYCFILILPFVLRGLISLKDWTLRFWVIWCAGVPLLLIFLPSLPLYAWDRWVHLLVYPLLFFAVEGLTKFWKVWFNNTSKLKRLVPKAIAVLYIVLLVVLSGFYVAASPESQLSFFSDNSYIAYMPSSMLESTISINDYPSLIACFDWLSNNANPNSSLIMHYALYDLAKIYVIEIPLIKVNHANTVDHLQNETTLADALVEVSKEALSAGNSTVYTVWWASGKGWYQISSLPSDFNEVYATGQMSVYAFNQTR